MPFANLPTHEKDAFFSLLDEYFTSRPDLLSRIGGPGTAGLDAQLASPEPTSAHASGAAIAGAAQRAITKNPAAASRLLAAGINHANSSPGGSGNSTAASNNNHAQALNVGRVAAAAQALSVPPKSSSPPVAQRGPDTNKLASQKKFGDVDVSSAGAMFRSLRGSTAAKNAPPPTVYTPPAFGKKASSGLPPPPVRRVSTSTSASAAHVPEPEEDAAQPESTEEEEAGEWAEALYDYTSQVLTLRTLLRAIFVGGERSASTSGGNGTRDGENIVRLVDRTSRWSKWTLPRLICQASIAVATRFQTYIISPSSRTARNQLHDCFMSESKSMWNIFRGISCPSRYTE